MSCDTTFEYQYMAAGAKYVAGADEVGRGSLAGPVVAAACILNLDDLPDGINDSKQLTRLQRERLASEIQQRAVSYSISRIEHDEIDQINILKASLRAMELAIKALRPLPDYVLIDGHQKVPNLDCPQSPIIKGDCLSVSVAAASIIAKVKRDQWMTEYDEQYPGYGFALHAGYNTRFHQEAIVRLGPSAIHRLSFRGVLFSQPSFNFEGFEEESPL
ncbi:MAG TPA: ribonuclease HII [Blastocatellia bacterium]|nr:ribonuclease HII [Blastocatellia bacterium]